MAYGARYHYTRPCVELIRIRAAKETIHGDYRRQEMRTPHLLLYRDFRQVLQHAVRGDGKDSRR